MKMEKTNIRWVAIVLACLFCMCSTPASAQDKQKGAPDMIMETEALKEALGRLYGMYREQLTPEEYSSEVGLAMPLEINADKDYGLSEDSEWERLKTEVAGVETLDDYRELLSHTFLGVNEAFAGMPTRAEVEEHTIALLAFAGFDDFGHCHLVLDYPEKSKGILWRVGTDRIDDNIRFSMLIEYGPDMEIMYMQYGPTMTDIRELEALRKEDMEKASATALAFVNAYACGMAEDMNIVRTSPWSYHGWPNDPLAMVWVFKHHDDGTGTLTETYDANAFTKNIGYRVLVGTETGRIYLCSPVFSEYTFLSDVVKMHDWQEEYGQAVEDAGSYKNYIQQNPDAVDAPRLTY